MASPLERQDETAAGDVLAAALAYAHAHNALPPRIRDDSPRVPDYLFEQLAHATFWLFAAAKAYAE